MWGNTAAAFAATVCIALGLAPQFPTMITLAERHLPMTASTGSWFLAGSGVGSLTLPFLAGLWFDRVGATALPMVSVVAASATLVWFVTVSRALIAATRRRYTPSAAS
jgi:fucose permease